MFKSTQWAGAIFVALRSDKSMTRYRWYRVPFDTGAGVEELGGPACVPRQVRRQAYNYFYNQT